MPALMSSTNAEKEAEFLFLKREIDLAGTLQELEYPFSGVGHELYYIPFLRRGDDLTPAV